MIVWPALLPPWYRITMSARSASRSVTFPFPSSPHWAPTTTKPGIDPLSVREPLIRSHDGNGGAHLGQAGDGPVAELLTELVAIGEIGRDEHRPLLLPALVDDRVELFEDPFAALLGTDVVDVQQVDLREPPEQVEVRPPRSLLIRCADVGEQRGHRIDRHGTSGFDRRP